MKQVRRRMIEPCSIAEVGINVRVNRIANGKGPVGHGQMMQMMPLRFSGVGDFSGRSRAAQMTAVAYLPATLAVKRRAVENDDARLIRTQRIHGFAVDQDRQHGAVSFVHLIPKEVGFPANANRLAVVHFEPSVIL